MPDYRKAQIYKITSLLPEHKDMFYVGSTCGKLRKRMQDHQSQARRTDASNKSQIHRVIDKYGILPFEMVLIEDYPCETKTDLFTREAYWIKKLNSINHGWNEVIPIKKIRNI